MNSEKNIFFIIYLLIFLLLGCEKKQMTLVYF